MVYSQQNFFDLMRVYLYILSISRLPSRETVRSHAFVPDLQGLHFCGPAREEGGCRGVSEEERE
jgi:hypothetical protein